MPDTAIPEAALEALTTYGLLDRYGHRPDALTAPRVATSPADKLELLERFGLGDEWLLIEVPELGDTWVARWDRLTLAVRSRDDVVALAYVSQERGIARKALRAMVLDVVDRLGLDRARYYRPAAR